MSKYYSSKGRLNASVKTKRIQVQIKNLKYATFNVDTRYTLRNKKVDSKTWKDIPSKHPPKEIWCSFINLKQMVRQKAFLQIKNVTSLKIKVQSTNYIMIFNWYKFQWTMSCGANSLITVQLSQQVIVYILEKPSYYWMLRNP